jgi:hypothetical protein
MGWAKPPPVDTQPPSAPGGPPNPACENSSVRRGPSPRGLAAISFTNADSASRAAPPRWPGPTARTAESARSPRPSRAERGHHLRLGSGGGPRAAQRADLQATLPDVAWWPLRQNIFWS